MAEFSANRADYVCGFLESLVFGSGTWEGRPFRLQPWQRNPLQQFYGTLETDENTDQKYRQYQYLYLEIPKKNGKTELSAALGLYHLVGDGEKNPQIYICAADKDNAAICFNAMLNMIELLPWLKRRLDPVESRREIHLKDGSGFIKVLSADAYSKHGYNASCVIFDELHSQPNRKLWDIMTFGAGSARLQPVWIVLTTAGDDPDRHSIGWEIHDQCRRILAARAGIGPAEDDDPIWLPVMYGLPDDPEELEKIDIWDEEIWKRCNPSIGVTVPLRAIRQEAAAAKKSEAKERLFRWLRLNQWIATKSVGWLPLTLYDRTQWHIPRLEEIYKGKVSDNSSGSGSSGTSGASAQTQEQSELVQKLTGWIQQLKAAFVAGDWEGLGKIVGDGINSAVAAIDAVDVGSKAGKFANNLITTLHSALASTDFYGIGAKAGQMLNNAMQQVDWAKAGDTIGKVMTAIPSIIIGFIQNADWKSVAKNVSELLIGALSSVTEWLRSVDWLQLGQNLWDLISNIDYAGIATSFFTFFGTALGAGVSLIGGFIGGVVDSIKQYFSEKIEECGGNVAKGLLKGIWDGLVGIKTWIVDNIFTPFIEGFKSAFGIHSPSTVMEEQGGFLISGLLNGITNAWNSITEFFSGALDALKKTLSAGWEEIKEGASTAWDKVSSTIGGAWENIKTGVSKAGSSVKSNVSDTWNKVKDTITGKLSETESSAASDWKSITSAAQAAGSSIAASASSDWSSIRQNILSNLSSARNSASGEWATMGAAASTAGSDIKNVASTDWQAVNSFITHNLATARLNAAAAWGDIKSDTNTAADNIASKTKSSFQSVKDGIVSAFSGAWTGAKSWINKLIGGVESMVNFIIRGINKMIGAFNKVASVGSKVGLDLNISEIATVKLPRLATGGIADGPTAAIIGEAGKEAVLPLERNTGWMAQLAQKIVELTGSGNAISLTIPIYLGGRKVTEYVIKNINQITKSTGVCPVKV